MIRPPSPFEKGASAVASLSASIQFMNRTGRAAKPLGNGLSAALGPFSAGECVLTVDDFLASKVSRGDSASSGLLFNRRNDARILDSIAQEKEPIALCLVENFNFPAC